MDFDKTNFNTEREIMKCGSNFTYDDYFSEQLDEKINDIYDEDDVGRYSGFNPIPVAPVADEDNSDEDLPF